MKITVLGYWGAYPVNNEGTSSYLVQSGDFNLLMDAGSASLIALENHLDPLQLDAVILSHYHYDHIADVGVLQFLWQLKQGAKKVPILPIYGHQADMENFNRFTMQDVSKGYPYNPAETLAIGPFDIQFLKTIHPVPCYAMRVTEKTTGEVFVFTADSGWLPEMIDFAKDADVLLADTYFFNGQENAKVHMTAGEVGNLAKQANVKKVVLTHLPQVGDLQELKQQAKTTAGENIEVILAEKNLVF